MVAFSAAARLSSGPLFLYDSEIRGCWGTCSSLRGTLWGGYLSRLFAALENGWRGVPVLGSCSFFFTTAFFATIFLKMTFAAFSSTALSLTTALNTLTFSTFTYGLSGSLYDSTVSSP